MLSNVVVAMDYVEGTKGSLVSIGGYGGCSACAEWHGYYSTAGRLEQYSFDSNQRSFGSKGFREELISFQWRYEEVPRRKPGGDEDCLWSALSG